MSFPVVPRMRMLPLALYVTLGVMAINAASAQAGKWSIRRSAECRPNASGCVNAWNIFGLEVAPDGRHLYALSWVSNDRALYGIAGWRVGVFGAPEWQTPATCVAHAVRGAHHDTCAKARGWPRRVRPFNQWGSIVLSPDGRNAYVAGFDTVTVFKRDATTGALSQLEAEAGCIVDSSRMVPGCATARRTAGAQEMALSPDGRSLYLTTTARDGTGVAIFQRDTRTGALTQLPGSPGCISARAAGCAGARQLADPVGIVVAPSGVHVYVTSADGSGRGSGLATFARDTATGALSQLPGPMGCINGTGRHRCARDPGLQGGADRLAIAPDGHAVYTITSRRYRGPRVFPVADHGALETSAGTGPWPRHFYDPRGLGVGPDGRVYVAGRSDGFFVYRPNTSGRRLRVEACWGYQRRPCRNSGAFDDGAGRLVAPSPDGRTVYIDGGVGIVTAHETINKSR